VLQAARRAAGAGSNVESGTRMAHGIMAKLAATGGLAAVMALSGCAGSSPQPHTAVQLAQEITDCSQIFRQPPGPHAMQDVVCPLPDYDLIEVTTFKTALAERQWFADPHTFKCPGPVVQGHLWVARRKGPADIKRNTFMINSTLGGQVVVPRVSYWPASCSAEN